LSDLGPGTGVRAVQAGALERIPSEGPELGRGIVAGAPTLSKPA
jgi:hypothetical protein